MTDNRIAALCRAVLMAFCASASSHAFAQDAGTAASEIIGPWRVEGTGEGVAITGRGSNSPSGSGQLELRTDKRVWSGEFHPDRARATFRYKPQAEEMNPAIPRWARQQISGQLEWTLEIVADTDPDNPGLTGKWYVGEVHWKEQGNTTEVTIAGTGEPRSFRLLPGASILDQIEADERARPLTPAEQRRKQEQAAREGIAEGNEAPDWERAAAAAMAGEESTGPAGQTPEQAEEVRRIQDARVAAREAGRRERLAQADNDSLKARRSNAENDLRRYEEMLDRRLKAEGRSQLSEEEYIERDRREARFLELMELTPEETAAIEKVSAIQDQVNAELDRAADAMGGASAENVAARADNAAMADAGTKTWRDFTFAGRMVSEVKDDIVRQREMGIHNNEQVMAAQNYLKRSDLTPEQRAAAEQYLARSVQQRGHNAEAILLDGAVVVMGAAADVGTLAAGGTVSRGVSKIFGTEAAAAGAQAGSQAGKTVAPEIAAPAGRTVTGEAASATRAAAEDLVATQRLPGAQTATAAAEDLTATQRLPNTSSTAAAEDLTATQLLPNAGRAATAEEAANATTRMIPQAAAEEAANASTRMVNPAEDALRSAETQVEMATASQSAAQLGDEAALQAQNLAREAELTRQVAQRARDAEQAVQKAAQEGRELTAEEAARYHNDIVTRQYNQQMNALAQQAREAGVAESTIQQLTQDAFGVSSKRGATIAMQNLVEETAKAKGFAVVASEQAEPIMHTITNIRSGSAGSAEVEVLRRNIREAASRGADYFDELSRQGTSTLADGFQAIADDVEIEALRQFARGQGLIE